MTVIETVLEQWENMVGNRWINKFDPNGKPVAERVRAGRKFYIRPEERNLLNSDRIVDEADDPFKNGSFRPIKENAVAEALAEENEVAAQAVAESAPNPNHMSDDELAALFEISNFKQFEKAVGEISSEPVLARLLRLSEVEEYGATVAKINLIKSMLAPVDTGEAAEVEQIEVGFTSADFGGDDGQTGVQPFKGVR